MNIHINKLITNKLDNDEVKLNMEVSENNYKKDIVIYNQS